MNIIFIIGTRPDAIKMFSTIQEFEKDRNFNVITVATFQHKKLLRDVIDIFKLDVDISLNVMKNNQTLSELSARLIMKLDKVYKDFLPGLVFVQGDTSSSLFGALAAYYNKIPVAHIEAGLRTYDRFAPFPEEVNRTYIDHIADYLFPPTKIAEKNLLKQGAVMKNMMVTGNTGIDALLTILGMKKKLTGKLKELEKRKIILVTTHRRESFGKPLKNIVKAVKVLAGKLNKFTFVLPVHPNPNVSKIVYKECGNKKNIILTEPLKYHEFVRLMDLSTLILTDSGGIQEEAPVLGKPVVVLREKTERPEVIKSGAGILAGTESGNIIKHTLNILEDEKVFRNMSRKRFVYGDGTAGKKIYHFIKQKLNK